MTQIDCFQCVLTDMQCVWIGASRDGRKNVSSWPIEHRGAERPTAMFIKHEHFNIWIHSLNSLRFAEKFIKCSDLCSLLFNQSNRSNFCLINYRQKCRFQTVLSEWFRMVSNGLISSRVSMIGSVIGPVIGLTGPTRIPWQRLTARNEYLFLPKHSYR